MHSYDTNSYFLISVLTKTDSKATNMCFFKYIFQLIILVPIFTDFADVVFSNPILITTASFCGCIAQTPYSSFVVVLCYSSSFLILFSFLLYIKFGNTGPRDNAQRFSEIRRKGYITNPLYLILFSLLLAYLRHTQQGRIKQV